MKKRLITRLKYVGLRMQTSETAKLNNEKEKPKHEWRTTYITYNRKRLAIS